MDALLRSLTHQPLGKGVNNALSEILTNTRMLREHSSMVVAGVAFSYVLICRCLRYRRVKAQKREMGYASQESLQRMTNTEAHAIIKTMAQLEFPLVFKQ